MKRIFKYAFFASIVLRPLSADAGEIGHYTGGMFGPWDLISPAKGQTQIALGGVYYHTSKLKNSDGDNVRGVDLNLDLPEGLLLFRHSLKEPVLGATYSFLVLPNYGKTNINAYLGGLNTQIGVDKTKKGWNDLYLVPANLTWDINKFYNASFQYGVWAPTGSYDSNRAVNNGLGYWSHDFRITGSFFPTCEPTTLLSLSGLYEFNTKKKGHDVTPGDRFVLEVGASHVFSEYLIIGIVGAANWEVTKTTGSQATDNGRDRVFSFGPDVIIAIVPNEVNFNIRALKEFGVRDRTQGYIVYSFLEYQF